MSSGYQVGQGVMNPSPSVESVRQSFEKAFKKISHLTGVKMLAGDGSTRSYYRVQCPNESYILQTNGIDDLGYRRFLEAHRFYVSQQLPISKVLAQDENRLWILLEDMGSEDLQAKANFINLVQSVRLLCPLATEDLANDFKKSWLSERTLDEARFVFEMDYFLEHFVQKLLGESVQETLKNELYQLAKLSANGPKVFCHRDFQSRNIMFSKDQSAVMIDFQDSQWGPFLYDAVSLCWDPYFHLKNSDRDQLFDEYLNSLSVLKLSDSVRQLLNSPEQLHQFKNLLIAERFIKAAGSFASFKTIRSKDTHLVYIFDSLSMADAAIEELHRVGLNFDELRAQLKVWLMQAKKKGWSQRS